MIISIICVCFAILIFLELCMMLIVNYFRNDFQWLITIKDECPDLDKKALNKFFDNGYDSNLGWVRKPNTSGVEKSGHVKTSYTIDAMGSRTNPAAINLENVIASFGDSYTFCRQVNDFETWQCYLTQQINQGVLNFGVGNYGIDQALLRYEQTKLPSSVKIVLLAFVPETIARIQSYWKHYWEFGNTFAFKPRFLLNKNQLVFVPNIMQTKADFFSLKEKLAPIQLNDSFYKSKFKSLQFRFPYILSFFRNPIRQLKLLYFLFIRHFARFFKITNKIIENKPFSLIMDYNIKQAHQMYENKQVCALFKDILLKFKNEAKKCGHKPAIMVLPQLIDLKMEKSNGDMAYTKFFQEINDIISVIDFTEIFHNHNRQQLFTNDVYGGHFSPEGNQLVANYLKKQLLYLFPEEFKGVTKKDENYISKGNK